MVVNLCLGKNASGYPAKICAFHLKRKVKKKEKRADKTTLSSLQKAHNLKKKKKKPIRMVPGGEGRGIKEEVHKTRTSGQSRGAIE